VFIGDYSTGTAKLYGGDVGWETARDVSLERPCPDLILNEAEDSMRHVGKTGEQIYRRSPARGREAGSLGAGSGCHLLDARRSLP